MWLSLSIMAIKDVTPLEITTAKLVLTMPATLIPESKSNFSKRVNGLEVTFFIIQSKSTYYNYTLLILLNESILLLLLLL